MPRAFLTEAERGRLERYPAQVPHQDVGAYSTITERDHEAIPPNSVAANRLGFALLLGTIRYLGFCPDDLEDAPEGVVRFLAEQLEIPSDALASYRSHGHSTRRDHTQRAMQHLGFRRAGTADLNELETWLTERALEHDRPMLLLEMACQRLLKAQLMRPAVNTLERLVSQARAAAQEKTFLAVQPWLTLERQNALDKLLLPEQGRTPLTWLRQEAARSSPRTIADTVDKVKQLRAWDLAEVKLDVLTPNRRKILAQIGRKSSAQALSRMPEERRYPVLLAFLERAHEESIDGAVDLFDRCLADTDARAGRQLDEERLKAARTTNEKVRLLEALGRIVLDPAVADGDLRKSIYSHVSADVLREAIEGCQELIRPADDNHFDLLSQRYSYLRQFAPVLLSSLDFQSNQAGSALIEAVKVLRQLNEAGVRKVPKDAPTQFIPAKWRPYVIDDDKQINRRYYEVCLLWELRDALRAGDVWLPRSRRYANPTSYLIPQERWPALRPEVCALVSAPADGAIRFNERRMELDKLLRNLDQKLPKHGGVRMEDGELVVGRLEAEDLPDSAVELEKRVKERLPLVELSDLLLEVDTWTQFSSSLEHAKGSEPRSKKITVNCHASILAQACNLGLVRMAQAADLSYDQLAWCSNWYLREETLQAANTKLVNFHYHQPLSRLWGGGALSSSDGQRFPVAVQATNATAIPRYFGYGRGLTFYSWTSDQFSQFGSKPIASTMRDATYVLDGILDNETELPLAEHTTDTAGYSDLVFALFDLLGMQFCPRLRDLGEQCLYRIDKSTRYENLEPMLRGTVNPNLILDHWDSMLHVIGSLKLGWVTASLFINKLQSYRRQNILLRALQDYGRLNKTIFILRYLDDIGLRRRIGMQLNKGEALHALRRFLFLAHEGAIRRRFLEEQVNQASCLNLVTNAVVAWNTVYMDAAIKKMRAEGQEISDEDVAHLSPARYEHMNPYGKYRFEQT